MHRESPLIFLIDDDYGLVVGLKAALIRAGFQVLTTQVGSEAVRLAREQHPDLILCDVMMPNPNGFEIRRRLGEDPETGRIPFIYLTARAAPVDKVKGLDGGADDYVTKPFDREELIARIRSVLRRNTVGRQQGHLEAEGQRKELEREITRNFKNELRSPISAVLQTLQLALSEKYADNTEEQKWFMREALRGTQHLQRLIEDLIFLNEMDQGRIDAVRHRIDLDHDLEAPLKECAQRWGRLADLVLSLNTHAPVYAPPAGFRISLAHLIDNACKYSPPGSPIKVHLDALETPAGGVRISVIDSGPGIPAEYREKIFERYFQFSHGLDKRYPGLGVGLTISRAVARRLGGELILLDSPMGSRFQMTIPPAAS